MTISSYVSGAAGKTYLFLAAAAAKPIQIFTAKHFTGMGRLGWDLPPPTFPTSLPYLNNEPGAATYNKTSLIMSQHLPTYLCLPTLLPAGFS